MNCSGTFRFHRFSEETKRPERYAYTTRTFYNPNNLTNNFKTKTFSNEFPMNYMNNQNAQSYQFKSKLSSNFPNTLMNSFQRGNNITNTNNFFNKDINLPDSSEFPYKKLTDLKFEKIISKGELSKIDKLLPQMIYNNLSSIENSHLKLVLNNFQNILKYLFGEQEQLINNNKEVEYLFKNENSNLKKTIKKLENDQLQTNVTIKANQKQIGDLVKKINKYKNILISSGNEKLIPKIKLSEIKMKNGLYSCQICPVALFKTYEEMHAHYIKKHFSPFNNNKNLLYNNTGEKLFFTNELNELKNEIKNTIYKKYKEDYDENNKNEDIKIENTKKNFKSMNLKSLNFNNLKPYSYLGLNSNNDINNYLEQLEKEQKDQYEKLNEHLNNLKNEVFDMIQKIVKNQPINDKKIPKQNYSTNINDSNINSINLIYNQKNINSTNNNLDSNSKILTNEITKGNESQYFFNNSNSNNKDNQIKNSNPFISSNKDFKESNNSQLDVNDKFPKENNTNFYNSNDNEFKENNHNKFNSSNNIFDQNNNNENNLSGNQFKENNIENNIFNNANDNENKLKENNIENNNEYNLNDNETKKMEKYIRKSNIIAEVSGQNDSTMNIKDNTTNQNISKIEETNNQNRQILTKSKFGQSLNEEDNNYIESPTKEAFKELFEIREKATLFNKNNNITNVYEHYQIIKMDKKRKEKNIDDIIEEEKNNLLKNQIKKSINGDENKNIISEILNQKNNRDKPKFMEYFNNMIEILEIKSILKDFEDEEKNKELNSQINNEINNKKSVKKSNIKKTTSLDYDDILSSNKSKNLKQSEFYKKSNINLNSKSKNLENLLAKGGGDDFM